MFYDVETQCKLPDKPRSFSGRVQQALELMPDSTAQHYGISLAVDKSLKYAFVSDENVHSFARSRASPDNVMQNYRGENFLQPQQWVVQVSDTVPKYSRRRINFTNSYHRSPCRTALQAATNASLR